MRAGAMLCDSVLPSPQPSPIERVGVRAESDEIAQLWRIPPSTLRA